MTTTRQPTRRYAEDTRVDQVGSEAEIRKLAARYGVEGYTSGWHGDKHRIEFLLRGRHLRFVVDSPPVDNPRFARTETGIARTPTQRTTARDQDVRRHWRLLVLYIKAGFEMIVEADEPVERIFLANVVLPNNETLEQWATPQIDEAYRTKRMPPLLPGAETMPVIALPGPKT